MTSSSFSFGTLETKLKKLYEHYTSLQAEEEETINQIEHLFEEDVPDLLAKYAEEVQLPIEEAKKELTVLHPILFSKDELMMDDEEELQPPAEESPSDLKHQYELDLLKETIDVVTSVLNSEKDIYDMKYTDLQTENEALKKQVKSLEKKGRRSAKILDKLSAQEKKPSSNK